MPVHDGSRSDQDERLGPPGPERSQRNTEQFVQGSQSTARLLRVQSQQLPTQSEVLEDEVRPGMESADQPAEEMSERQDHGKNFSGKIRIQSFTKSFIQQVYDVLARHTHYFCMETGGHGLLSLIIEKGKTYYLRQTLIPMGDVELNLVNEEKGKSYVAKLHRSIFEEKPKK